MSILILYATKTGATKECAELLSQKINCTICSIEQSIPNLENYDTVILGTGVRMGKLYKPIKNYMKQHLDILVKKRIAVFICNAYPDTFQKVIEKNLPIELVKQAVCIKSFGGKVPFSNRQNVDWLNSDNLNDFIALFM